MTVFSADALLNIFFGGVIGSIITSLVSWSSAKARLREEAATALWQYHYSLVGYANSNPMGREYESPIVKASIDNIHAASMRAYPYSGYLHKDARDKLFTNAYFEYFLTVNPTESQVDNHHKQFQELALCLENELNRVFPRRFWHRFQKAKD